MSFPQIIELDDTEVMTERSTQHGNTPLGTLGRTPDGILWRYCKNGATALAAGVFGTFLTTPSNEQTVTVAHAIGVMTVHVTIASISKDDFKDGYLVVTAGGGIGEKYRIKANTATDGPGSGLVGIDLYTGLKTAWVVATTDVDVFKNPYSAIVVCPTDGQQRAVVLTQRPVTASYYFWGLKEGHGSFLCDVAAGTGGLELDEKNIVQSLNHAGYGFIDDSPDAAAILAGYRQVLGYLVTEEDVVDDEAEFGYFYL